MKLHELQKDKIYIGEDGEEYVPLDNSLCRIVLGGKYAVNKISLLTQDFTPKKVKRIVELVRWANVYPSGKVIIFKTKEDADNPTFYGRISCVEMRGSYVVEE